MVKEKPNPASISPLTGKEYAIPEVIDDKAGIDLFVAQHPGKKVVVVQGLGFVGSVMSLVVANALTEEYAVIGIDLPTAFSYWKIQSINEGMFSVIADDPKIGQFYKQAREKKNLYATCDAYAYSKADIVIVDINLDVKKTSSGNGHLEDYAVDLAPFKKAIGSIGSNCQPHVLVLVETTVPPGTSQKIVRPILEECLQQRGLPIDQLKVGHSYERVMPGPKYVDSIQNFYRVYSGVDEASAQATEKFLRTVISTEEYPLTRLGNTQATEMAKVLENSYRAMNIAFMVEWSRFAEEAGVNIYEVVNAIRMRPTHKNIMLPGLGVGGYCLTKDPLLASWARIIYSAAMSHWSKVKQAYISTTRCPLCFSIFWSQYNGSLDGKKCCCSALVISMMSVIPFSQYRIYRQLIVAGCNVILHDPHVMYWEEKDLRVNNDLEELLGQPYDLVVITTGHKDYRNNASLISKLLSQDSSFIYDTIGILTEDEIGKLKTKHIVKVIGRGDL
jgi:nucleotide sugar dehydrogenase